MRRAVDDPHNKKSIDPNTQKQARERGKISRQRITVGATVQHKGRLGQRRGVGFRHKAAGATLRPVTHHVAIA